MAAALIQGERHWSSDMYVNLETMMQQSRDFLGTPRLNFEEWAVLLRSTCGGDHEVIDPNAFAGWMRERFE